MSSTNTLRGSGQVSIRERLSHFTWGFFECTMSTGAIATLLSQQPFTFRGLETIGTVFFILDLVLFVLFSALIIFRFSMKPSALLRSLHHPVESFFFGTFWVSIALILYCVQQYGVPSCGPWLVKTLEICFWTYAALALLVVVFQYHIIFDEEQLPVKEAMPAWLLPCYPLVILGPLAAVLEYDQPAKSALNIMIGGLLFQGLGWTIAFFMYTIYFMRLISRDIPKEPKRPGMYVAVGPAAYTSNTFVALGMRAPSVLPPGFLGITTIPVGDVWQAIAIPVGIFLWLVSFWFSAMATVSLVAGWRKVHFTMNMWSLIFPNAGLTIAAIQIGKALDSTGIKAVTSAMTVILVVVWVAVAVATVRAVVVGQVLWPGMDEDEEEIEGHEEDGGKEA